MSVTNANYVQVGGLNLPYIGVYLCTWDLVVQVNTGVASAMFGISTSSTSLDNYSVDTV